MFTGPALLTSDSANSYYKAPVPHGQELKDGSVSEVCSKLGLQPVCHSSSSYKVDGCVLTAKKGSAMGDLSETLCGQRDPRICPAMYGLFVSMKGWTHGADCGVLEGSYCTNGNGYTSGPGGVYTASSKSAQYYGLCALPKFEAAIEGELTNNMTSLEGDLTNKITSLEAGIADLRYLIGKLYMFVDIYYCY